MPYNQPHNLLSVFGDATQEGDVDGWSFGLRFAEGAGAFYTDDDGVVLQGSVLVNAVELDGILDQIEAKITTWWNATSAHYASGTRLTGFKFNGLNVNGHYVNPTKTIVRDMTPLPGTGGTQPLPAQISLAATFRTAAQRGPAARGRMYLPPLSVSILDTNGKVTDAKRDAIANATATLLTSLSNWSGVDTIGDPGRVCVMSKIGAGATRRVNAVDVGDRFDVQRRRASKMKENRSARIAVDS